MKYAPIILAIMALTVSAHAADIVVPLGSITVPDAAVADVAAWLNTQPDLYTIRYVEEVRTDPDTGEEVTVQREVRTIVPETPKAKLARIVRVQVLQQLRAAVRGMRQERANAAAQAEVDALPDPIADEE